jgi:hypothetical protein
VDKSRHLYWLLAAVGINRLCSLVPAYRYFDPFPFYNIVDQSGKNVGITLQSYIYGISTHAIVLALFHLLSIFSSPKYSQLFGVFFLLEVAGLIDYLLIYEHPIFHLWSYGVEFTDIKIIFYTYFIIRWNHQT